MVAISRPLIIDTTLRDGEQMPGVCFSPERKMELAQRIADFGAGVIEVMPVVSPSEQEVAKKLSAMRFKSELRAVCRLKREDIELSASTGVERLLLVAPVSDLHLKVKFGIGREEGLNKLLESVDFACSHCGKIDVALEDASRADPDYLLRISDSLSGRISLLLIGDTLGVLTPFTTRSLIRRLKSRPRPCRLEFHGHNDFGMAVANTVSAISAGADAFTATFCGIGERAGNAAMEEVVVALKFLEGIDAGVEFGEIASICRQVAESISVQIHPNKPWAGSNAFTHESGIHADAVLKDPGTYEAFPPETVGQERRILFGKKTGRHALERLLRENGMSFSPMDLVALRELVKGITQTNGAPFTPLEIIRLFEGTRYGTQ